jgi:hypothetical protein
MRKTRHGLILSTHSERPTLLLVKVESREAILEVYKGEIESKGGRKIRFDVENDTILLENRCNMGLHNPIEAMHQSMIPRSLYSCPAYRKMFTSIKNLAVDESLLCRMIEGYEGWSFSQFESLEIIFIMMTVGSQRYSIMDDEQFTLQKPDQVQVPEIDKYQEDRYQDQHGLWETCREELMATLLDDKEFKPEWNLPAIKIMIILRDS